MSNRQDPRPPRHPARPGGEREELLRCWTRTSTRSWWRTDANKTEIKIAVETIFKVQRDRREHDQPHGQEAADPVGHRASVPTPSGPS